LPTARDLIIPKGCSSGETLEDEGVSMASNSTQDDRNSNKNGRCGYDLGFKSNQITLADLRCMHSNIAPG